MDSITISSSCVSVISAKALGSGEHLNMTFKTEKFHLFVLLCFFGLFFIPCGVCVEMGVNVTDSVGWLEEREIH